MLLATGSAPDKLDGIAPLFGATPPPPPPPPEPITHEPPAVPPASTAQEPPSPSVVVTPPSDTLADQPSAGRHRLELAGMASGGGLVLLSFFLWGAARGTQSEIDTAPTRTQQDLVHLRDLESRGDTYAAFGNLFAISGLVIGGLGTYFYIKDHRRADAASTPPSTQARVRITPTLFDHGGGLVLTLGGPP
jgi:hypothetical protein